MNPPDKQGERAATLTAPEPSTQARSRLEPVRSPDLGPWHKSQGVTACNLYWMPTGKAPVPFRQRQWCLQFFTLLREQLAARLSADTFLFLQMKVLHPNLMDPFLRNVMRFQPLLGLSRKPGAPLPDLPDQEYADKLQQGKIKYDHKAVQPDYCYWFLKSETEEQTALYFGMGGLMMLFAVPPESAKIAVPTVSQAVKDHPQFRPMLSDNRIEKMVETVQKATSPLFPRTKNVFGRGLEDDLQYPALKFIVPLLTATDFLDATPAAIEEWFSVFDVILTESPTDGGLLLASRQDFDLDPLISDLVNELREQDAVYPEFA